MRKQYQYPAKSEPVLPDELTKVQVPVSNWFVPLSEPVRTPPATVAEGGSVGLGLPLPRAPFVATQLAEPVRPQPQTQYLAPTGDLVLTDAQRPETVEMSKWFHPLSEPVRLPPPSPEGGLSYVIETDVLEAKPTSGWEFQQPYQQPPPPARQYQSSFEVVLPESLRGETIEMSKWFVPMSEPVRPKPRLTPTMFILVLPDEEDITMDKWYRAMDEPVRPKEIRLASYAPGGESIRPQIVVGAPTFEQYGSIKLPIDPDRHPDDAVYRFQGMMKTSSAGNSAQLRLFNTDDNSAVTIIGTTSTTPQFVESNALTLPSGVKVYRVDIGGPVNGGTYGASMAKLEVVAS